MSTELTQRDSDTPETVSERPAVRPAVDIYENSDEYLLIADLPAVSKDGLNIHLADSQLTIEGKVSDEGSEGAVEQEYQLMDYRRTFELPEFIDRDNVLAELVHGVLTLHLPKTEAVKPKQIEIRAG